MHLRAIFQYLAATFRQAECVEDDFEGNQSTIDGMLEDMFCLGPPHHFVCDLLSVKENAMTALTINP